MVVMVFLYFMFVLGFITLINRILYHDLVRPLIAGSAFMAIVLLLFISKTFRHYLSHWPAIYRSTVLVFLFCVLFAQHTHSTHTNFPFIPFNMYANIPSSYKGHIIRCIGTTVSSKVVILDGTKLFGRFSHGRINSSYTNLVDSLLWDEYSSMNKNLSDTENNGNIPENLSFPQKIGSSMRSIFNQYQMPNYSTRLELLKDFMIAYGTVYNMEHPSDPLRSLKTSVEYFDLREKNTQFPTRIISEIEMTDIP